MKALLLFAILLPLFFIPMAFAEEITIDVPFTVAQQNCETYYDPDRDGIEIKDGISEVEVELRYVLDSTNRDEIISSIIEQSHLDVDVLVDAMDIQVESDDDSSDSGDFDNSELEELREENQLLREENNDLRRQLANLNNVLMEQIRVIMDTLAALRS